MPTTEGRVIAVYNLKGGTAKSTMALNVGASLAMEGYRVAVLDMDPQANSTAMCHKERAIVPGAAPRVKVRGRRGAPAGGIPHMECTPKAEGAPMYQYLGMGGFTGAHLLQLPSGVGGVTEFESRLEEGLRQVGEPLPAVPAKVMERAARLLDPVHAGEAHLADAEGRHRLWLMRGSLDLADHNVELAEALKRPACKAHVVTVGLARRLYDHMRRHFDFVFVDLGPSRDKINETFLVNADFVMPPATADAFGCQAVRDLFVKHLPSWFQDHLERYNQQQAAKAEDPEPYKALEAFLLEPELPRILPVCLTKFEIDDELRAMEAPSGFLDSMERFLQTLTAMGELASMHIPERNGMSTTRYVSVVHPVVKAQIESELKVGSSSSTDDTLRAVKAGKRDGLAETDMHEVRGAVTKAFRPHGVIELLRDHFVKTHDPTTGQPMHVMNVLPLVHQLNVAAHREGRFFCELPLYFEEERRAFEKRNAGREEVPPEERNEEELYEEMDYMKQQLKAVAAWLPVATGVVKEAAPPPPPAKKRRQQEAAAPPPAKRHQSQTTTTTPYRQGVEAFRAFFLRTFEAAGEEEVLSTGEIAEIWNAEQSKVDADAVGTSLVGSMLRDIDVGRMCPGAAKVAHPQKGYRGLRCK